MYINKNIALSSSGFLFNPANGDSFSVNDVGHDIIKYLQAKMDVDQIITSIKADYKVEEDRLEEDIEDFIHLLKSYKLVK
jgi:hypothetical protein